MDVYQCPCCELRFISGSEMKQHMALDHPDVEADTATAEQSRMSSYKHRHAGRHEASSDRNSP